MNRMRFSHIGLCVGDAERSLRFYTDALGFSKVSDFQVGDEVAPVLGLKPPVRLKSLFVAKDGVQLEFLEYTTPEAFGPRELRPMNQFGLTHLSVIVDAVEPVIEAVLRCGGQVHRETYVNDPRMGEFIYCSDPDGIRVELMRLPG